MVPNKIILKGYYGFGNFGDDVLMLAAFGWLREHYPQANITICTDSANASYIPALFSEPIQVIQNHEHVQADWIIHGGGGIYFDFKKGSARKYMLNKLIRTLGPGSFKKLSRLWQKVRGRTRIQAPFRAGFGIGIGTYTPSSARLYADIQELADFKFLLVRDSESILNLSALNISCPAVVSSDLAFMSEYWLPAGGTTQRDVNVIGMILRDWMYTDHAYLDVMKQASESLKAMGFIIKFFSFDSFADKNFIEKFSAENSLDIWNPFSQTISSFLEKISVCQLVITSRAHGAIVSACLGIPSVCFEIEPKLVHISNLLSDSSVLVGNNTDASSMVHVITTQFKNLMQLREAVKQDHARNRRQMLNGLAQFQKVEQAS